MESTVHDEAVQQDEMQARVTRSSPSVGDASARQASELDDIARRISEGYPNNKSIISSSGKSMSRRRGDALRTARFLLRKIATAAIAVVAALIALVAWTIITPGRGHATGECEFKLQVWRRRFPVRSRNCELPTTSSCTKATFCMSSIPSILTSHCARTRRSCSKGWRTST